MNNFKKIFFMSCFMLTVINKFNIKAEILPFNLGEAEISHGKQMITLELAGVLGVPQIEGEFPVIIIVPDVEASPEVMKQYQQLLKIISEMPALGILLDLSPLNEIESRDEKLILDVFDFYRTLLNRAIHGESLAFGEDLYNKGSFSNVIIIGCGQSVDSVYQIIEKHHERQMSFSGALFIEPLRKREVVDIPLPDVPTSIVVSYERLKENAISLSLFQKQRQQEIKALNSMVYVLTDTSLVNKNETESISFINQYTTAFIEEILSKSSLEIGLSPLEEAPQILFNTAVKTSLILPDSLAILQPKTEKDPHVNALGGTNRFVNLRLDHYKGLVDIYKVKWDSDESFFEIELPKQARDLTHYDALSLYFNYHHDKDESLSFIVEFQDVEGQYQQVSVDNQRPLNRVSSTIIPFYNQRIQLKQLMEVDLTSIKTVRFIFEGKNTGELSIGDISLVKELK